MVRTPNALLSNTPPTNLSPEVYAWLSSVGGSCAPTARGASPTGRSSIGGGSGGAGTERRWSHAATPVSKNNPSSAPTARVVPTVPPTMTPAMPNQVQTGSLRPRYSSSVRTAGIFPHECRTEARELMAAFTIAAMELPLEPRGVGGVAISPVACLCTGVTRLVTWGLTLSDSVQDASDFVNFIRFIRLVYLGRRMLDYSRRRAEMKKK